jgi:hypothetical protein
MGYNAIMDVLGETIETMVIRSDGVYVLVDGDHEDTVQYRLWLDAGNSLGEAIRPPQSAPVLSRLPKAELWRRVSDEEAEAMDAALSSAPLRLRRLFQAAQYLDTGDADYPMLRAGIVAAIGEERAVEVLAPTE